MEARGLDPILQPTTAIGVLNVRVFDADVAAVGLLERGDDVAQLHLAAVEIRACVKRGVEIGVGEVKLFEGKFGERSGRGAERIEVRLEVADRAVGVDEVVDAGLLEAVDDVDVGGGVGGTGESGGEGAVVVAEAETLEEGAPGGVDRIGLVEPGLIHLLDHGGVGVGRDGHGIHGRRVWVLK